MRIFTEREWQEHIDQVIETGRREGRAEVRAEVARVGEASFAEGLEVGASLRDMADAKRMEEEPDLFAVEVTNVHEGPAFSVRSFEKGRATFVDIVSGSEVVGEGIALRNPSDQPNEELGFAIAMQRAFEDASRQAKKIRNRVQRDCGC